MEYVKLTPKDLNSLIDCCQLVIDYKARTLTKHNWIQFEMDYLPSLVESLHLNQFRVADPHKNIVLWILDQICHSRRLVDGVNPKECVPLADTVLGEDCLEFLRAASRGQISYDSLKQNQQFTKLFT